LRRLAWPRGGLWREADFLHLWAAQTVSQFGTQISLLALPLVAVVALKASAFEVALLGTFDFLPFLLFALPAGVWVDRLPRRPILVLSDLGRALALASIPIVAAVGSLTIGQLYVVGFLVGTLTVLFDVAYQSYLPSLVSRDRLVDGNSKLEVSRSAAQVAGPGIAGGLIAAVTAPYAIVADAVSFVGSALFVFRIRGRESAVTRGHERSSLRSELWEGLRFLFGDPRWRSVAAYVATFNFFGNVGGALFFYYAVHQLGLSAGTLGLVLAVGNLGWLLGAVIGPRLTARFGIGAVLVASGVLSGVPGFLVPLANRSTAIPFLIVQGILVGLAIVLYNVNAISLMQALTPDRLLGRMNASRRFVVWGTIPLGALVGGALSTQIGLRPTLFVGAAGMTLSFLFLYFSPLRKIDQLPEEPSTEELLVPPATVVADG
jgi:MFS family permease